MADLGEQLAEPKQELGTRVADLTQLNAVSWPTPKTPRQHLEERIATITEESQRREELLQNDLAAKSKELADTLRKLTAQQEKARQVDALTRDNTAKTDAVKALELKLKTATDESKKKTDELRRWPR